MTREEAIKWIDALSIYLSICDNQSLKDSLSSDIEKTIKALDMAIEALKTQEWIPCSERMPETIGEYLITVQTNQGKKHITTAGYYYDRLKEFGTFRRDGTWEKWDAIAWMPLPPAYKENSNESVK